MNIPYEKIPVYSPFFLDYINNYENVKQFFEYKYSSQEDFLRAIGDKEIEFNLKKNFTRAELAEILKTQNKFFNSSEKTFSNIELLKEQNTLAVVSGQQVGLLTGNLYTIIKALNTVRLADELKQMFPRFNFVPVFWLESDDHDFLEVNHVRIVDKENNLRKFEYFPGGEPQEKYLTPVGSIILDENINSFIKELRSNLIETEYTDKLFDFISRSYKPGIDMTTAFARFVNYITGDAGIIFCNPSDRDIKNLLVPVFEKELNIYPRTCELVIDKTAIIEQRYESQVKPKPINIYYNHNGSRYLIEPRPEEVFALRNSRQKFAKQELFDILYSNPELFSANVILRPVCQDYLLPTIAYIGGPSEIAYFAQYKDVYELFGMKMPVIFPRASVTLLENIVSTFLQKYKMGIEKLYNEKKATSVLMNNVNDIKIDELIGNFIDDINELFYKYSVEIEKIDKNIANNFRNKNEKYKEGTAQVRQKLLDAQAKQNESSVLKLKKIMNLVFPEQILQERYYNISYFINKYGLEIIEKLINETDIYGFSHQYIDTSNKQEV